jgi:HD superfamily phosphohydrolase
VENKASSKRGNKLSLQNGDGQSQASDTEQQDRESVASDRSAEHLSRVSMLALGASPSEDWTGEEDRQEFYLPVSGFVWLFPEELAVVDHPAFQRLALINQLGQAYVVFRGATHKRFEHSLGALHIAQRMIEAVAHNSKKRDGPARSRFTEWEERFIRLGALVHDIGHMAAGHTIEDELGLASRHDEDHRLDLVFGENVHPAAAGGSTDASSGAPNPIEGDAGAILRWRDRDGRTLAALIDERFSRYVPSDLVRDHVRASEIVRLLIRKAPAGEDKYERAHALLAKSSTIRLQPCRDVIGNTICADLLDYLHRDWYHVGKPRPFDDRLLQYMEIRNYSELPNLRSPQDRFVISLGQRPNLRTDAISNILELLEWRYRLCESVLFHRTKLAAAAMLDRALFELWGDSDADFEGRLLPLSDDELLAECVREARDRKGKSATGDHHRGAISERLLTGLQRRQLLTQLSTRFDGDLPAEVAANVRKIYAGADGNLKRAAAARNRVLRVLESDFGLSQGSLAMYCPRSVNAKIAKVQIAVGPEIQPFDQYEVDHPNALSGGHLDAQLHRFQRLWRVHFFIDRAEKERLGEETLFLLRRAIEKLALGHFVDGEDSATVARSLAAALVHEAHSPWSGGTVCKPASAALNWPDTALGSYPLGGASIRAHIKPPQS